MSIKRRNLGDAVEEIMKFKMKADKEVKKCETDYITLSVRAAKGTLLELQKIISSLEKGNENEIDIADKIYNLLVAKNHNTLDKAKSDYDYWYDINEKFNH